MAPMENERKPLAAFNVLSYMSETSNIALRFAPLANVDALEYNHKKGTLIKIRVPGNLTGEFMGGNLIGGLILVQKSEFEAARQQAENAREQGPHEKLEKLRERVLRNANGIDRALSVGQDPIELLQAIKLALLASVELD
jgi:hypothetical protein